MNEKLDICPLEPEDTGGVAAFRVLLAEYQAALDDDLRVPDLEREMSNLFEKYAGGALMLASVSGTPVGCVVVSRLNAADAEIKRLYVVPAARRGGAGRALMDAAIAIARGRGFKRVVLDTHRERLAPAYRLYREMGFVECEPYETVVEYQCPTYLELVLSQP